jgi:thermitase
MSPLRSLAWVWGLSLLGLAGMSAAQPLNPHALKAPPFAPDRVLVKFRPGTAASAVTEAHRQAGGKEVKTISAIGVQVIAVPAGTVLAKVAAYKANPNVLYAEPDQYRLLVIPNEEPGPTPAGQSNYFGEQWYLNNTGQTHTAVTQTIFGPVLSTTHGTTDADIDAPEAWDRTKGFLTTDPTAANTPKVAVLDSGADCDTLELQGKCLEQTSLVGLNPSLWDLDICPPEKPACDNFGHGTFVASELAANTDNGEGIAGAGWNTSFGVFKVCYLELVTDGLNYFFVGLCPLSASAEAITLAATDRFDAAGNLTRSQYHVITMSYGSDLIDPDTLEITPSSPPNTECDAVLYAWNHGVVVVAGAGNNGNTDKFYPAACTDDPLTGTGQSTVIAVAASDHDDNRASFSTFSTDADDWVSLAAPGKAIIGVLPDAQCELPPGTDSCVNWWDGTSMSTPLVAAGAALVWADLYQQSNTVDGALAPSACTVGGTPCNRVVRGRLENGADKVGARGQNLLQWTRHGRLNIANAVANVGSNATPTATPTSPPPTATPTSTPTATATSTPAPTATPTSPPPTATPTSTPAATATSTPAPTATPTSPPPTATPTTAPTASFTYSCSGLNCFFDGTASSDDKGIIGFEWSFGDGPTPGSGATTSHTYTSAGTYTVTLTVRDASNQTDTATAAVRVRRKGKTRG